MHSLNPLASGGAEYDHTTAPVSLDIASANSEAHTAGPSNPQEPSTTSTPIPKGYGKIVRDTDGTVLRVELAEDDQRSEGPSSQAQNHTQKSSNIDAGGDEEMKDPEIDGQVRANWVTDLGGGSKGTDSDIVRCESPRLAAFNFNFFFIFPLFLFLFILPFHPVPHVSLPSCWGAKIRVSYVCFCCRTTRKMGVCARDNDWSPGRHGRFVSIVWRLELRGQDLHRAASCIHLRLLLRLLGEWLTGQVKALIQLSRPIFNAFHSSGYIDADRVGLSDARGGSASERGSHKRITARAFPGGVSSHLFGPSSQSVVEVNYLRPRLFGF